MGRRHKPFSRRIYQRSFKRFLRVNAVALIGLALLIICPTIFLGRFLSDYLQGATQATAAFLVVAMIVMAWVAVSGSMNQVAGAWGEDNTRDVLRVATKRGWIAGWVDGVEIYDGDVDHLVVLHNAAVVAIDSKWHTVALSPELVADDVSKACRSADRARSVLRAAGLITRPRPLVVCWGSMQRDIRELGPIWHEGVEMVAGQDLKAWLKNQATSERSPAARDVLAAARGFVRKTKVPLPSY